MWDLEHFPVLHISENVPPSFSGRYPGFMDRCALAEERDNRFRGRSSLKIARARGALIAPDRLADARGA
jgi:hypothetical protein